VELCLAHTHTHPLNAKHEAGLGAGTVSQVFGIFGDLILMTGVPVSGALAMSHQAI